MSQRVAFSYGADVAAYYGTAEVDAVAVVLLHELRPTLVEVTGPPVPNRDVGDCVYCRLCCSIAIHAQVKHKRIQIVSFSQK